MQTLKSDRFLPCILVAALLLLPASVQAATERSQFLVDSPADVPAAIACVVIFLLSYLVVMSEEATHLRKSKPVILGAGIIWVIIAWQAPKYGFTHEQIEKALAHDLDEYAGLALFLLTAMTYIATLEAGNVFQVLRAWLVGRGFSYRALFWVTGFLAFFLSPVADNMTTALVMGTVIMAVGADSPRFVSMACVNVVVAANAGGAFSPFGDITTLMVWQAGHVTLVEFFALFIPSLVNFVLPAAVMTLFLPAGQPERIEERITMKRGARFAIVLFAITIGMAISFEQLLGLPAYMGMMTGLSLLMFFGYYHRMTPKKNSSVSHSAAATFAKTSNSSSSALRVMRW